MARGNFGTLGLGHDVPIARPPPPPGNGSLPLASPQRAWQTQGLQLLQHKPGLPLWRQLPLPAPHAMIGVPTVGWPGPTKIPGVLQIGSDGILRPRAELSLVGNWRHNWSGFG